MLVRNKGVLPKYFAESTHPPIIDIEVFEKAQEIMLESRNRNAAKSKMKKYVFTSKFICGNCGKSYKRKTRNGIASWNCSTYLKYGKDSCRAKQIPESILCSTASEVLEIDEFDESIFTQKIKEIQVPAANQLVFVFYDGMAVKKEWTNKSRSESWSEEKRQLMRYRSMERRSQKCGHQEQLQ